MDRQTVVIKKYGNRRLYDSTNSRYVNLDEIAEMVRQGRDVQVVDATTGEDRTRAVLTQIVVEQAKGDEATFPVDVLRQMVAATGQATKEAAMTYMSAALEMYQNAYRAMATRPSARVAQPQPAPPPPDTSPVEVDDLKKRIGELESIVARITPPKKRRTAPPRKRR